VTADKEKSPGREGYGEGARSGTARPSRTPSPPPSHSSPPTQPVSETPAGAEKEEEEKVERDLSDLLADVERERDEYLELARRTKADFENYRKRVSGETAAAAKRGRAELVRALLPVVDNLERALAAAEPPPADSVPNHLAEGVRLVREELAGILKRSGVESYEPTGEQFDPHEHEAMMTRPAEDGETGKVVETVEKGYRLDGQILRPARVVVGEEKLPPAGEPADGLEAG
jgi:molecular chaperone GrpE